MIEIHTYTTYNEREILDLYASVGWTAYTDVPEKLKRGFANSLLTLGAYKDGKLVGLIRTLGDGETVVLIQDLLLHPEYQRQGIGTLLINRVLEEFCGVRQIQLATDNTPKTIAFYKSLGFCEMSELGCCAFMKD